MKKKKYQKPQVFKPTKQDELAAMEEVAKFLTKSKILESKNFPELSVQGKL